jgi:hypothetical protein
MYHIFEDIARRAHNIDRHQIIRGFERPQNRLTIWKAITVALLLMLVTSTFDNNCEKIIE